MRCHVERALRFSFLSAQGSKLSENEENYKTYWTGRNARPSSGGNWSCYVDVLHPDSSKRSQKAAARDICGSFDSFLCSEY